MKKVIRFYYEALIILLFVLGTYSGVFAQWQNDVRLTNDPGWSHISFNNARCIVSNGDTLHIIWFDDRDGNSEIYYKRSLDNGINWGPDIRLTDNNSNSEYPAIAVSKSYIHIVWSDSRDGNFKIFYKRSSDGGISWGNDTSLTNESSPAKFPSIYSLGNRLYVVWSDGRDANWEIYFKSSSDNGLSWNTDTRLSNAVNESYNPSVVADSPRVHVVWYDFRDGNGEIYYIQSSDLGINWGSEIRLTNYTQSSIAPSISVSNSFVHVVWQDKRDGAFKIFYMRSTDDGINWGQDTCLTDEDSSFLPSIDVSGLNIHLVWAFEYPLNREIFYKRSTDGGISWEENIRLTNSPAEGWLPFVSVSGLVVNVLWRDERDGNYEIYFKQNLSGNATSLENIKPLPVSFKLNQNYPNPFNPSTTLSFVIGQSSFVTLKVYDVLGNEIVNLVNEEKNEGVYTVDFDASHLASGMYLYRLKAGSFIESKKMLLLK